MVTKDKPVKDIMSKLVVTLSPNKSLSDALYWMNKRKIGSITITKDSKAIGIITRSDLKRFSGKDFTKIKLNDAMSRSIYSVTSDTSIEETERIMDRRKVGSILVIDDEKVKGIVTRYDLRTKVTSKRIIPEPKEEKQSYNDYKPSSVSQKLSDMAGNAAGVVFVLAIVAYFVISIIGLFTADCAYAISGFCLDWRNSPTDTVQTSISGVQDIVTGNSTIFYTNPIPSSEYNNIQKIYFSKDVVNQLESEWSNSGQTEFRVCAFAKKYDDGYVVDKITKPETQFATKYVVYAEDCPYNSVGTIHSHPIGNCLPSSPSDDDYNPSIGSDVENLLKQNYPLMGIMCDPDIIVIYTKNHYQSSISLLLIEDDGSTQDITTTNPCRGNRYCNNRCWEGCASANYEWECTKQGGQCLPKPGYCEPGSYWCIDRCWQGCGSRGTWTCTSNGGVCI